ncbi:6,7-dimethyl-8-ribityllumazine synthase [Candidatus Uhrbacteria bacterium]|nr:6,7-dimethyl-8-ribityllumazine synthase [Candidatus Uhrbacteria bacterium]
MQIKKKTRIALLATEFHPRIADQMIAEASKKIEELGGRLASIIRVPGAYEIPLVATHLLSEPLLDALVVLGYIEKGETLHGEVMGHVVHTALMDLQLKYDKPIGFGIIGPGATEEQALMRIKPVAERAVEAVCKIHELFSNIDNTLRVKSFN